MKKKYNVRTMLNNGTYKYESAEAYSFGEACLLIENFLRLQKHECVIQFDLICQPTPVEQVA